MSIEVCYGRFGIISILFAEKFKAKINTSFVL